MKLIISILAALSLVGFHGSATEATPCAYAGVAIVGDYHSITFSVPGESPFSLTTYNRTEAGVVVESVTTMSNIYTFTGDPVLTSATQFSIVAPGCVGKYNPPEIDPYFYKGPIGSLPQ